MEVPTAKLRGGVEFTIYNESFNKVKSFTYPLRTFEVKNTVKKALADITKKTVIGDPYLRPVGKGSDFATLDDFKQFVLQNLLPDLTADCFFIDQDGNFAYHDSDDDWIRCSGYETIDDKEVPTITQTYYYYNKEEKTIYYCSASMAVEIDLDHLTWTEDDSQEPYIYTETEGVGGLELYDYDIAGYPGCRDGDISITQNIFNDDDKYEFLVSSSKQVDAPANVNTTLENGLSIAGAENGKLVIKKREQDKYYEDCIKIVNEDGEDLFTFTGGADGIIDGHAFYRLNGKTYASIDEYSKNGTVSSVLYLLDTESTGITELARINAVKGMPTYNLQGMRVRKDAKGVVIQQGGKKYLNK